MSHSLSPFECLHLLSEATGGLTAFGETINQMLECGANPICSGFLQIPSRRDVAQPGRALAWGARGRQFKSARPDHLLPKP